MNAPYLSVVVASRNDGHGGDPLARLQTLINSFSAQCGRYALDAELIVVDWNPPPDRPRLRDALHAPVDGPMTLRVVEVPPELHATLPAAEVLPLFQMIAKNVGIRRARGEFVLSTNLDVLLSNALVEFIAARRLEHGRMYRVDRHDVESPVPVDAPLDAQMAFCETHHLRLQARAGTYPVDANGRRERVTPDVVEAPHVSIGAGWHMREGDAATGYFRWASADRAVLHVDRMGAAFATDAVLELDVAANPYEPQSWIDLEVADASGTLARRRVSWRPDGRGVRFCVTLPDGVDRHDVVLQLIGSSDRGRWFQPLFERRDDLSYRLLGARLRTLPVRAALEQPCSERGPLQAKGAVAAVFAFRPDRPADADAIALLDGRAGQPIAADVAEVHDRTGRVLLLTTTLRPDRLAWIETYGSSGTLTGSLPAASLVPASDVATLLLRARTAARDAVGAFRRAERAWRIAVAPRLRDWVHRFDPSPVPDPPFDVDAASGTSAEMAAIRDFLRANRPRYLHLNACGDFQLMARDHWFDLRGFAELATYSMSLDGLLSSAAENAGIREIALDAPLCIYHQEHDRGSGWTPEGEAQLRRRLAERGVTWVEHRMFHLWAASMAWLGRPMIFSGPNWGFGDATLPEFVVQPAGGRV